MKSKMTVIALLCSVSVSAFAGVVGTFKIPVGESKPMPAFPGHSFEFEVEVKRGERLNFTSMYGASNDWFFSSHYGVELRHGGKWDITKALMIYDTGTEEDQNAANDPDTAANQSAPNTGLADPVGYVRCLSLFGSFAASNFIKVTSEYMGDNQFKIHIYVKESSKTPLSPGVFWTTKAAVNPVFTLNRPAKKNGLEAQAEDGNPAELFEALSR